MEPSEPASLTALASLTAAAHAHVPQFPRSIRSVERVNTCLYVWSWKVLGPLTGTWELYGLHLCYLNAPPPKGAAGERPRSFLCKLL